MQRRGGRLAVLDGLSDGIEVAGADFALVLDGREALLGSSEFCFLQFHESRHLVAGIAVHAKFPGKMLAYNCSPSFNWKKNLDDATIAKFQKELGAMGYKFQFITLAGFHALNYGMFNLAHGYARNQMSAFVELQEAEFAAAEKGFTAVKHQREVGTGYFDAVTQTIQNGQSSTTALHGSTEDEQFFDKKVA